MSNQHDTAIKTAVILATALWAAAPAHAERWRAVGPATDFVADWSQADKTDSQATAFFLERVWPAVDNASKALHGKIAAQTGKVYAGPVSSAESSAGVVCFPLRVEQLLPWYAVPTSAQVKQREFSIFAAQGQSEPVAVAVHALRDVKNVSVSCGPLVSPVGEIPASAVTSRLSLSYTMEPRGRGKIATRQMLLLKVAGWDIPQAHTYEWVIDVHVPADAKPGQYTGQIAVQIAGKTVTEFELALEVLPFALTDNGCRWGAFMTVNPGYATEAWCDLNARYGFNSLAWWGLDDPALNWTWDGCRRGEEVLAKLRYPDTKDILSAGDRAKLPQWVLDRWDGVFVHFKTDEVIGLPADSNARAKHYKEPLTLKPELGRISAEQARYICYDRPGTVSNFSNESINSVRFIEDEELARFDAGMKRLKKYGFAGPLTWFGSGGPPSAWEIRLIGQKFGPRYSAKDFAWRRAVTPENSNHTWYLANAAVAKAFDVIRTARGWPEIVWCPCDESFQYEGATGRPVPDMIGEMMPYIRRYAPNFRIYTVVWHRRRANEWQCATLMRDLKDSAGRDSTRCGPYQVVCTNCPNDEDRAITWNAGGEYWTYTFAISTLPTFSRARFAFGFNGARHLSAVTYNFADNSGPLNLSPGTDVSKSLWMTGQYTTNYYLAKDPGRSDRIDYAIASHAMLGLRAGIYDRKYVETLRNAAYSKNSAEDIAFVEGLGALIGRIGDAGKGGVDDFTADVRDETGAQELRRRIAERIKALVSKK